MMDLIPYTCSATEEQDLAILNLAAPLIELLQNRASDQLEA